MFLTDQKSRKKTRLPARYNPVDDANTIIANLDANRALLPAFAIPLVDQWKGRDVTSADFPEIAALGTKVLRKRSQQPQQPIISGRQNLKLAWLLGWRHSVREKKWS